MVDNCDDEVRWEVVQMRRQGRFRVRRRLAVMLAYSCLVLLYVVLGGLALWTLEKESDRRAVQNVADAVAELRSSQPNATDFDRLLQGLVDTRLCQDPEKLGVKWTFMGAVYFAFTTVSTIGYGSIVPATAGGRAFTAVYTLLGIALVVNILRRVAEIMMEAAQGTAQFFHELARSASPRLFTDPGLNTSGEAKANVFQDYLDAKGFHQYMCTLNESAVDRRVTNKVISVLADPAFPYLPKDDLCPAVALFYRLHNSLPSDVAFARLFRAATFLLIWLFSWAAAFSVVEGWPYPDALWFCFVTLTTVGFGDFEPAGALSRGITFVFAFFGLGLVAWVIDASADAFKAKKFWLCQVAFDRGIIGEKLLDVQGITPCRRTSTASPERSSTWFHSPYSSPRKAGTCAPASLQSPLLLPGHGPSGLPSRRPKGDASESPASGASHRTATLPPFSSFCCSPGASIASPRPPVRSAMSLSADKPLFPRSPTNLETTASAASGVSASDGLNPLLSVQTEPLPRFLAPRSVTPLPISKRMHSEPPSDL
ncbi:TWiK family of potassium channels protein 18 [Diplonema papillatum]|nr:TWiK family of potassium channels protein 18 [Diplonema papillatum]